MKTENKIFLRLFAAKSFPLRPWTLYALRSTLYAIALIAIEASALEPASVSIISLREEPVADVAQTEFYRGAPLLLTNCIAFAGTTTNSARQNLTGLAIIVSLGTITSNLSYTGTVANASNGVWWARIDSVPTNWDTPKLQLKLTNSTDVFIYPFKNLKVKSPL